MVDVEIEGAHAIAVAPTPAAATARPAAAALALAASAEGRRDEPRAGILVDLGPPVELRPSLLCADDARALADLCGENGQWRAVPRGRLCMVAPGDDGAVTGGARGREAMADVVAIAAAAGAPLVVHAAGAGFRALLEDLEVSGADASVLIQAGRDGRELSLLSALSVELRAERRRHRIWRRAPGLIAGRRALAGLDPGGATATRARAAYRGLRSEEGQALPALAGLIVAIAVLALAFVALGGAVTAKGRAQRATDLAALSAARSMRDDFPRLFVPALRANGTPNPEHLDKAAYEARAEAAAHNAASRNDLPPEALKVSFTDGNSLAPLRVAVTARPRTEVDGEDAGRLSLHAEAALAPPVAPIASTPPDAPTASGGGYAGPLASRQGKQMRPDVAAAFDRMSAAAASDGVSLIINSAYRSDAEQAALFAANPDPRMVAPPGTSLHRCGTELDLGPSSAYGWLAANAGRFGFLGRYSWEPWHYGFTGGPPPCSQSGNEVVSEGTGGGTHGDGRAAGDPGLPGFVPPQYRAPLIAAAARHDVSAALLAAQLMAESNFNPAAVSPAGAQGIAQFMPGTAAAYGLGDPFDPVASIEAQATLMGELIAQFGDPRLALAAYNAGPAPVEACSCVPAIPETQAYVARIMGMLGGAGQLTTPQPTLEVRLVS